MERLVLPYQAKFFDPGEFNLNIVTGFLDQNNKLTPENYFNKFNSSLAPLYVFHLRDKYGKKQMNFLEKIINSRTKRHLKTYIVYDFSYENGITADDWQSLEFTKELPSLILLNTSAQEPRELEYQSYPIEYIDFFALSAVERERLGTPVCKTPVSERKPNINLLLGRVYKNKRDEAIRNLYRRNLLNKETTGLIGNLNQLSIKTLRKCPTIKEYWGSADGVDLPFGIDDSSQGYATNCSVYENSQVSYVCETWEHEDYKANTFITEKTYRAILNKSPFVIQGEKGTLASLRSKGFKTFDNFIKEDYENDVDATIDAAERLLTLIPQYKDEIQHIVDRNYAVLQKLHRRQITKLNRAFEGLSSD